MLATRPQQHKAVVVAALASTIVRRQGAVTATTLRRQRQELAVAACACAAVPVAAAITGPDDVGGVGEK